MKKLFVYSLLMLTLLIFTINSKANANDQIFKGDFRYRYQNADTNVGNTHTSFIRLRIGTCLPINERIDLNIRLTTYDQLLSSINLKNTFLDTASIDYTVNNFKLTGGKMLNPFYTPGNSELLMEEDFNPEGLAFQAHYPYLYSNFFIKGGYLVLIENVLTDDITTHGVQGGLSINSPDNCFKIVLGAGYYRYPDFANDFENIQLFTEINFDISNFSIMLYNDYVVDKINDMDDLDTASYLTGLSVAIDKWIVDYNYRSVELSGATLILTDTDFGIGKSHKVSVGYEVMNNVTTTVSYLTTENVDADIVRGDIVFKF